MIPSSVATLSRDACVVEHPRLGHSVLHGDDDLLAEVFRVRFHCSMIACGSISLTIAVENVGAVEKVGIRAYMVLPNHDKRGPLFGTNDLVYYADAASDTTPALKARPCVGRAATTRRAASGTLPGLMSATPVP
jgi:hypothetical protein